MVSAAVQQEEVALQSIGLKGTADFARGRLILGMDKLHGVHQTDAAHIPDHVVFILESVQIGPHDLAHFPAVLQYTAFIQLFQNGQRGCTGDWVSAEGSAMSALGPLVHNLILAEYRAQRQAAGDGLGRGKDVGFHTQCLPGKEVACTAKSALDLVENQKDAVLVAQVPYILQPFNGGNHIAALSLNWLHDNTGHHRGVHDLLEQIVELGHVLLGTLAVLHLIGGAEQVGVLGEVHAGHHGLVVLAVGGVGGGDGRGSHGAAVERILHGDDDRAMSGVLGQLHGAFVGFRAGIGKIHLIFPTGLLHQLLHQGGIGLVVEHIVPRVDQRMQLLLSSGDDLGVAVPQRVAGDSRCKVQNLPSILGIEVTAFPSDDARRRIAVERHRRHQILQSFVLCQHVKSPPLLGIPD